MNPEGANPNPQGHILRICLWTIVGVMGWFAIPFIVNKPELNPEAHAAVLSEMQRDARGKFDALEQRLKLASRQAAARRKQELETALGGPVAAAFKNPDFPLSEALRQGALSCAPTNSSVQVDVDRFTEFTVTISSDRPLTTNQMIAVARSFLPQARKFVDALRFSVGGSVVAELDRQDIEFAEDWTKVPDERVAMLLARELPVSVAQDSAALDRFKEEQRLAAEVGEDPSLREKITKADLDFRQTTQNAYEHVRLAVDLALRASRVAEARSFTDLDARGKLLSEADDHLKQARDFWTAPSKVWRSGLADKGIKGEAQEILAKGLPPNLNKEAARLQKAILSVQGQIESARYLLELLVRNTEKWRFSPGERIILFTDREFADRFKRAERQVADDYDATEKALHSAD